MEGLLPFAYIYYFGLIYELSQEIISPNLTNFDFSLLSVQAIRFRSFLIVSLVYLNYVVHLECHKVSKSAYGSQWELMGVPIRWVVKKFCQILKLGSGNFVQLTK